MSALALAAIAMPSTSASDNGAAAAKRSGTGCPDGRLCLWSDTDYQGQKLTIRERRLSHRVYNKMNDDAESLKLRKSGTAVLYEHVNGEGDSACFPRRDPNIPDLFGFDNRASSTRIFKDPEC